MKKERFMHMARRMTAGTTPDHDLHDGLLFSTEKIAHCTTSKVPAQTRGSRAGRTYSDWSSWVKGSSPKVPLRLTPSTSLNLPICDTAVLRSDGKGAPHYTAAIPPPSDRFLICDGRRTRHVSALRRMSTRQSSLSGRILGMTVGCTKTY